MTATTRSSSTWERGKPLKFPSGSTTDGDGTNDLCLDGDGGGINDVSGMAYGHGFGFVDGNCDGVNDRFRDEDGNGICDVSGMPFGHPFGYRDEDGNGRAHPS